MNRRRFFQLSWGAFAVAFFWKKLKPGRPEGVIPEFQPLPEVRRQRRAKNEQYPIHECVDRPNLPCPACMKWTGDEFATVRSKPQFGE